MFEKLLIPENLDLQQIPLITLAYYGDAVHTLFVRTEYLKRGLETAGNLHKICSKSCSASVQADALENSLEFLDEYEKNLLRRARNSKTHKPPKSCDLEIYKKATAFEVLVGYLVLKKDFEKLKLILEKTIIN
ncbi:MAG: Mini-ribonuclease 3 [Clostridia bacterium]|nr:Mini-ribonuclease 3 [Clostridia bacterium]